MQALNKGRSISSSATAPFLDQRKTMAIIALSNHLDQSDQVGRPFISKIPLVKRGDNQIKEANVTHSGRFATNKSRNDLSTIDRKFKTFAPDSPDLVFKQQNVISVNATPRQNSEEVSETSLLSARQDQSQISRDKGKKVSQVINTDRVYKLSKHLNKQQSLRPISVTRGRGLLKSTSQDNGVTYEKMTGLDK